MKVSDGQRFCYETARYFINNFRIPIKEADSEATRFLGYLTKLKVIER